MDLDASNNHHSESNKKNPSYIQIVRSIIGGASLGAIIGTPLGFVGSAVGAGIGSVIIPFLVLQEDQADKQSSLEESNES